MPVKELLEAVDRARDKGRIRERERTLPAVKAAEKILDVITETDPEDIAEALRKIGLAGSTWGLLWGLENISLSGKDLEFYELKGKILEFMAEIHADKRYPLAALVMANVRARRILERVREEVTED